MEYIELSRDIYSNMPVFPGDAGVEILQTKFFNKHGLNNYQYRFTGHSSTHMDGPLHMLKRGIYLSQYPVGRFFSRGVLLDARGKKFINLPPLFKRKIRAHDIVLIFTDWGKYFGKKQYFTNYPAITTDLAKFFIEKKVNMVGLDTPSPDYEPYNIHKQLFSANILIMENLCNLEKLINKSFKVVALPLKSRADSAPCRVVGVLKDS